MSRRIRHVLVGALPLFALILIAVLTVRAAQEIKTDITTRRIERRVGGRHFEVLIRSASKTDERALAYLVETLRVEVTVPPNRADNWAFRNKDASVEPNTDEIALELKALDGGDPMTHTWLLPAGFDFVRPGIIRASQALISGLAMSAPANINRAMSGPPPPSPDQSAPFRSVTGRVVCRAWDEATAIVNPLIRVRLQVNGTEGQSDANGSFRISGRHPGGSQRVEAIYTTVQGSSDVRLTIMDDVQRPWREARSVMPRTTTNQVIDVGDVEFNSVDCELWRLGSIVVADYKSAIGKAPPAGQFRIMRNAAVWDWTPYAQYDHVVLATNFSENAGYRPEKQRRSTLYHEFGHTVRHVADGDEAHWGWDFFRFAYARIHHGCGIYNSQFAFNEGWANYWQDGRVATSTPCKLSSGHLDWNESLIGKRLLALSQALCTPAGTTDCRRKKMVEVLEKSRGAIHTLRDFELRYCALFAKGNSECISSTVPKRPAPPPCPPDFFDDGATCRLDNIKAKPSYGRGAGEIPTACADVNVNEGGLCYTPCKSGYSGAAHLCWKNCPTGFPDNGAFCAKPPAYGRGTGYAWEFGDPPFDLSRARARCERDHGVGGCTQDGLIYYPRCKAGYRSVGCCVCSPICPSDMPDIGVSCAKPNYDRGIGTIPTRCPTGKVNQDGLCYPPCREGFTGVGPVCWGRCEAGFEDRGATCYREPNVITKY